MDKRVTKPQDTRRRHAEDFKQALVRRTLEPGASVAAIAQEAGVNANLLFNWRRLHLQAQGPSTCGKPAAVLLPVKVLGSESAPEPVTPPPAAAAAALPHRAVPAGTIEIDINGARVRLRGAVDETSIHAVLRALARVT
ncbi:IS66-like element accessory protein TnpA [Ideonella sp. A 288]|uniref:IS66-like element accessory protein TnpA n=1 Tax=Ideonella sp. A 288 TaxID=1962181 RepID=UPI000B4A99AA